MKWKVLYGALAAIVLLAVVPPTMVWLKCPGHISINAAYFGVALEVSGWIENRKNSIQQRRYTKALEEKLKPMSPMVSVYDAYYTPTGKRSGIRQHRFVSLFEDTSFIALESRSQNFSHQTVIFVSGKWTRETGTSVSLQRQDGTNFIDYAFMDLSSTTNFPPRVIELPFRVSPTYEAQRNLLLRGTNQVDETGIYTMNERGKMLMDFIAEFPVPENATRLQAVMNGGNKDEIQAMMKKHGTEEKWAELLKNPVHPEFAKYPQDE